MHAHAHTHNLTSSHPSTVPGTVDWYRSILKISEDVVAHFGGEEGGGGTYVSSLTCIHCTVHTLTAKSFELHGAHRCSAWWGLTIVMRDLVRSYAQEY